ncbi:MAG: hypothetical protein WC309_01640 [Candidatus Paceibacterota bacterium]|jgi:hypothetical protein
MELRKEFEKLTDLSEGIIGNLECDHVVKNRFRLGAIGADNIERAFKLAIKLRDNLNTLEQQLSQQEEEKINCRYYAWLSTQGANRQLFDGALYAGEVKELPLKYKPYLTDNPDNKQYVVLTRHFSQQETEEGFNKFRDDRISSLYFEKQVSITKSALEWLLRAAMDSVFSNYKLIKR